MRKKPSYKENLFDNKKIQSRQKDIFPVEKVQKIAKIQTKLDEIMKKI